MAGVLIVLEAPQGQVAATGLELATQGRALATNLGGELVALVPSNNPVSGDLGLGAYGVDRVLHAQPADSGPIAPDWLLATAYAVAQRLQPLAILVSHGGDGRALTPALAFRLGSGAVTDATALRLENGQVVATKPVYGGSALAELAVLATPAVVSLRPRAFEAADPRPGGEAMVETVALPDPEPRITVLEEVREAPGSGPRLKDAKVVVAGGRGLGGNENWPRLEELATVLGAAVGASRAVTDAGWVPPSLQVGLTGVTIAPDLYIAVGISGAVQHIAGISGARNVVAINRDADANIFKYARFGAVGDWKAILPSFTRRLRELKG